MNYSPSDQLLSDAELLSAFMHGALPRSAWTHQAHVRVAYLQLGLLAWPEALEQLRSRIQALNAFHGTPETPTRGFHETITVAFLRLIAHAREQDACTGTATGDSLDFCARHPALLDRQILLRHYSRERLASSAAKHGFVEPDLLPLPVASLVGWDSVPTRKLEPDSP